MNEPLEVTPWFRFSYINEGAPLLMPEHFVELLADGLPSEQQNDPNPLHHLHTVTADQDKVGIQFEEHFVATGLLKKRKTPVLSQATMEATIDDPRLFVIMTYAAKAVMNSETLREQHTTSSLQVSMPSGPQEDIYQRRYHEVAGSRSRKAASNGEKTDLPSSGITHYKVRSLTIEPPARLSPIDAIGRQHEILSEIFGDEIADDTIRATYGASYGDQDGDLRSIYNAAMERPNAITAAWLARDALQLHYKPQRSF